ncbi:MAG: helix-turn-helix transcriptional regulator, partial [Flexilinea sp.]|nr:helix-turn-helix transcriptional regulator [Flexilinea sp.]
AFYHYNEGVNRDNLLVAYGHLLVNYINTLQEDPVHSDIVEEIRINIVQNFSDSRYELDQFLRSLPFSYDYLRKLFKKEMGITPHQYLCNKRLDTAAEWLSSAYQDSSNIADIARTCGFNEPLYFSRMFKKKFGIAPSFYRTGRQDAIKRLQPDEVKIRDLNDA